MSEVEGQLPEIYLQPGEVHLALQPSILRTILGSCIGVTFWNARLGIGALFHALLPRCPKNSSGDSNRANGHRYVDFSIRDLAQQFDQLGSVRSEVQVKVFGADVLPLRDTPALVPTVGKQNCAAAIEILRAEGLEVVASSMGGTSGLKIQFHTGTGEVLLQRLSHRVIEDGIED